MSKIRTAGLLSGGPDLLFFAFAVIRGDPYNGTPENGLLGYSPSNDE